MTAVGGGSRRRPFWRRRPVTTLLLGIAAVIVAVLLTAVLARETLLTVLLRSALVAYGVPKAEFTVDRIGFEAVELTDVRAGDVGELAVGHLTVELSAAALLHRHIARVVIEDVALKVAVAGDGISFGSLDPLLAGAEGGEATGEPVALPDILVRNVRIEAATPAGPISAALAGTAALTEERRIAADGTLALTSPFAAVTGDMRASGQIGGAMQASYRFAQADMPGGAAPVLAVDSGNLEAKLADGAWQLDATVDEPGKAATLTVAANGSMAPGGTVAGRIDATVAAASGLWAAASLAPPTRGSFGFRLDGEVTPSSNGGVFPARADGELELTADKVDHPVGVRGLAGSFGAHLAADGQSVRISIAPATRIDVAGLRLDAVGAGVLPAGLANVLDGPLSIAAGGDKALDVMLSRRDDGYRLGVDGTLRLRADPATLTVASAGWLDVDRAIRLGEADFSTVDLDLRDLALEPARIAALTWRGSLRGRGGDLTASGTAHVEADRVALPGLALDSVKATAEAQADWHGDVVHVRLRRRANVALGRIACQPVTLPHGAALTVDAAAVDLTLPGGSQDGVVAALSGTLAPAEVAGRIDIAGGAEPFVVGWRSAKLSGRWTPDESVTGQAEMVDAYAQSPQRHLALREIALVAEKGPAITSAKLQGARLIDEAAAPRFAPLRLAGHAELHRDVAAGEVMAGLAGREDWPLRLTGQYDLRDGAGEAHLRDGAIVFAAGGLQPGDITPALAWLGQAAGRIEAGADVTWTGNDIGGVGQVRAKGVSFKTADATIDGLEMQLLFKDFAPIETAPGQLLKIASVDAAVPLRDVEVRFSFGPSPSAPSAVLPELRVEHAQAHVLGGTIGVEPMIIRPGATPPALVLRPHDFDLSELLTLIAVDGLSGSGKVSGRIPVSVRANGVAIVDAVLSTDEAGVISYQSDAAKSALGSQGEQTKLMLQALENFHFKRLTITVNKAADGEAHLLLRMLGANPDVLDGHPFQFNINVTGNVDKLIGPVLEIYRASTGMIGRIGGMRE